MRKKKKSFLLCVRPRCVWCKKKNLERLSLSMKRYLSVKKNHKYQVFNPTQVSRERALSRTPPSRLFFFSRIFFFMMKKHSQIYYCFEYATHASPWKWEKEMRKMITIISSRRIKKETPSIFLFSSPISIALGTRASDESGFQRF